MGQYNKSVQNFKKDCWHTFNQIGSEVFDFCYLKNVFIKNEAKRLMQNISDGKGTFL